MSDVNPSTVMAVVGEGPHSDEIHRLLDRMQSATTEVEQKDYARLVRLQEQEENEKMWQETADSDPNVRSDPTRPLTDMSKLLIRHREAEGGEKEGLQAEIMGIVENRRYADGAPVYKPNNHPPVNETTPTSVLLHLRRRFRSMKERQWHLWDRQTDGPTDTDYLANLEQLVEHRRTARPTSAVLNYEGPKSDLSKDTTMEALKAEYTRLSAKKRRLPAAFDDDDADYLLRVRRFIQRKRYLKSMADRKEPYTAVNHFDALPSRMEEKREDDAVEKEHAPTRQSERQQQQKQAEAEGDGPVGKSEVYKTTKDNETPTTIAKKYNVQPSRILQLNDWSQLADKSKRVVLKKNSRFSKGTEVNVPASIYTAGRMDLVPKQDNYAQLPLADRLSAYQQEMAAARGSLNASSITAARARMYTERLLYFQRKIMEAQAAAPAAPPAAPPAPPAAPPAPPAPPAAPAAPAPRSSRGADRRPRQKRTDKTASVLTPDQVSRMESLYYGKNNKPPAAMSSTLLYPLLLKEGDAPSRAAVRRWVSEQKIDQVFGKRSKDGGENAPNTPGKPMRHLAIDLFTVTNIAHKKENPSEREVALFANYGRGGYVLLMICKFSRYVLLRALNNKEPGTVMAMLPDMIDEMRRLGSAASAGTGRTVKTIMMDNGDEFKGPVRDYLRNENIHVITTIPGNPASNGIAERAVGTTRRLLQKAFAIKNRRWRSLLKGVQDVYNAHKVQSTGLAPNEIIQQGHAFADDDMEYTHEREKAQQSRARVDSNPKRRLQVGDTVLLRTPESAFNKFSKQTYYANTLTVAEVVTPSNPTKAMRYRLQGATNRDGQLDYAYPRRYLRKVGTQAEPPITDVTDNMNVVR